MRDRSQPNGSLIGHLDREWVVRRACNQRATFETRFQSPIWRDTISSLVPCKCNFGLTTELRKLRSIDASFELRPAPLSQTRAVIAVVPRSVCRDRAVFNFSAKIRDIWETLFHSEKSRCKFRSVASRRVALMDGETRIIRTYVSAHIRIRHYAVRAPGVKNGMRR